MMVIVTWSPVDELIVESFGFNGFRISAFFEGDEEGANFWKIVTTMKMVFIEGQLIRTSFFFL